jgi:arylsulfatase
MKSKGIWIIVGLLIAVALLLFLKTNGSVIDNKINFPKIVSEESEVLNGVGMKTLPADKPNVVFMLVDNVGYGDISAYNLGTRGKFVTKNIDNLIDEGLMFTQFMVEPGCTPSRAGLMTGRYSIRSGLSLIIAPGTPNSLSPDEFTIGEMFKDEGYNTAYLGKWHLDSGVENMPHYMGFDSWKLGFSGTTDVTEYTETAKRVGMNPAFCKSLTDNYWITRADTPNTIPTKLFPYDTEYRKQIDMDIKDFAVEYITENANKEDPFFLMIGWTRPHFPNVVNEEFKDISGIGRYGDGMMELDMNVGDVVQAIKDAGIEDETIVIFVSDNGGTKSANGVGELYYGSNGPWRGELGDAYEGSIRTIGSIKWPGMINEGSRTDEMIALYDFIPTLGRIIGANLPNIHFDGIDQTDFLIGNKNESDRNSLITFIGDRIVGVRWNQFRIYPVEFVDSGANPSRGGISAGIMELYYPQVYNIEADQGEQSDIFIDYTWLMGPYMSIINEYYETLEDDPNPKSATLTDFRS